MFNRDGLSSFFRFYILKNFKSFRIEVQASTNRIFSSMLTIFLKIGQQLVPRTRRTFHPRDLNLLFTLFRECSKNQI